MTVEVRASNSEFEEDLGTLYLAARPVIGDDISLYRANTVELWRVVSVKHLPARLPEQTPVLNIAMKRWIAIP
jgi:hypothetical protein